MDPLVTGGNGMVVHQGMFHGEVKPKGLCVSWGNPQHCTCFTEQAIGESVEGEEKSRDLESQG